ncbi:MAG: methionine--tRNA ligase [Prevotellaceae bacterium]|jgi:methionyl-tRNA synthetase|nr:methionine--tRNA ligase [Prevotellaceae bacterium]
MYKRYLITSALPYANGPVHIGHLAGVYVPADIYARYLRLRGRDVVFIGGSDEHGVPITIKARHLGVSPQDVVDKYHNMIKDSFERFGITFDIYSRTTSRTHHETASAFFRKLYDDEKFIEQTSEQFYDEESGQFLADRYIVGTCPKCGFERAYGDQCESCGSTLSSNELINPKSAISGSIPVLRQTSHWYLPLDRYQDFLEDWILNGHKEWKTNVYGQCKSWLDQGLQPRAVSRDLSWGVPIPVEGAEGKVLYVWFDAPIGYISNTKELLPDTWELYWKDAETKLVHFIGKDNIVFHCIVFPSMLKAHGDFILPDNVPANEFLNLEGDKISTSGNWAIWLHEYLDELPGKEDVLRYALCANAPETKDNDFTWKDFQTRNNSELVAILGNFINRALSLTQRYFDGKVPEINDLTDYDREVIAEIPVIRKEVETAIETFKFREALKKAMDLSRLGNKYLADTEPWKIAKTDMNRVATILNISLQISANLSIILEPFLPFSMKKLRRMLNIDALEWDKLGTANLLSEGHQLAVPELLFDKIEDDVIEAQINKLQATKKSNASPPPSPHKEGEQVSNIAPQKETIQFDDFGKMDVRTVTVVAAERVPKTDKLLKLTIDTGLDTRIIVSGIAEFYQPEEIIGKQVCVLVNLAQRKIKGIESQGMILMAKNASGKMCLVQPSEKIDNGAEVG